MPAGPVYTCPVVPAHTAVGPPLIEHIGFAFTVTICIHVDIHVFASVISGASFARENAGRIRKIGYVFVAWHIIYPILQFFGGRIMLDEIAFNVQGVVLYSSFEFNLAGLFAGFAIIVLAGVLREAADIHREQALTV